MARVTVNNLGLLRHALDEIQPKVRQAINQAMAEALAPPPDGFVRLRVSATVAKALLDDELALGAFLVRVAKKGLKHD